MSDPDLWEQVLAGGGDDEVVPAPEPAPAVEVGDEKEEEGSPESGLAATPPSVSETQAEQDLGCSWCNHTGKDLERPDLGCVMCDPYSRPDLEPRLLRSDEDCDWLTDEQIEACMALRPPKWLLMGETLQPTDENIRRLGAFVGKKNPVPIKRPGGDWSAEHRNLTKEDFVRHLAGKWLLGAYLLDDNDRTGVAVCDIDAEGDLRERALAGRYYAYLDLAWWSRVVGDALSDAFASGVHVTLTGGKGAHVICVLPERAPAAIVRRQLHWMCVKLGLVRSGLQWGHSSGDFFVECFPKQDEAGKGLGNLIRLPNGQDPTTGRKSLVVVDDDLIGTEDSAVQAMYRVDPTDQMGRSRREIQRMLDDNDSLVWLKSFLGDKYEQSFQERCEALVKSEVQQMRNAVGQAIHMAGWWDSTLAAGLVSELEMIAGDSPV